MKNYGDYKIAVIGFGHIGRYLKPCYEALLGEKMKTNMIAVKGTTSKIKELKEEFGFPILVDENYEALNKIRPDLIIFSPKPQQVHKIMNNSLKPYFEALRKANKPLPIMLAFAPDPAVTHYANELGEDLRAVNIIPNMVENIQEIYAAPIAFNMLTFDPRVNWEVADKQFVFDFISPLAPSLDCAYDTTHAILAAKLSCHSIYEICTIISKSLKKNGQNISHNSIASVGRAYLRSWFDTFSSDIYHCSISDIDITLRSFVNQITRSWYDGIIEYCLDQGVDSYVATRLTRGTCEIHFLTVQIEDLNQLKLNTAQHATKGGVLENSIRYFNTYYAKPLENAVCQFVEGTLPDNFYSAWKKMSYKLTEISTDFGTNVSRNTGF